MRATRVEDFHLKVKHVCVAAVHRFSSLVCGLPDFSVRCVKVGKYLPVSTIV